MAFISAFALVCQNVLTEKDGVSSIIRMVELFGLAFQGEIGEIDKARLPPIPMCLFAYVRFSSDDTDSHTLAFSITRPSGDVKTIPIFDNKVIEPAKIPEADRAISVIGQIGVDPKEFGRHEVTVHLDNKAVAATYFILMEQPPPSAVLEPPILA
jgi:hypothetical protein